ncbi:MAG: DUF2203 family protein [Deltaproteobacteria bacterium]|nr:MAG: DUF2203 family protein [Deltaproteobacteria bacterium]
MSEKSGAVVVPIHQRKTFSYEEACRLFPVVRRITERAYREFDTLAARLVALPEDDPRREEAIEACQTVIDRWIEKIRKLGCEVKGLWLVDFDSGTGYYCWKYPEPELNHFHTYEEGFRGRVPIH